MSKYSILVAVPGSGQICVESARMSQYFTHPRFGHEAWTMDVCLGGANFNNAFLLGLNFAREGKITHLLMQHTDVAIRPYDGAPAGSMEVEPGYYFGDCMLEDMDRVGADCISLPLSHKDRRYLTMVAIGTENKWSILRRFTAAEIALMPQLFSAASIGYPNAPLLHGTGAILFDLRREIWQTMYRGEDGRLHSPFTFNYTEDIWFNEQKGAWEKLCSSEDWAFSWQMWKAGVQSWVTSRVALDHLGPQWWPGKATEKDGPAWLIGLEGDKDTAHLWKENDPLRRLKPKAAPLQPPKEALQIAEILRKVQRTGSTGGMTREELEAFGMTREELEAFWKSQQEKFANGRAQG